ncbi:type 1 glutamine amidotransferase domain-containing protein [Fictibacillus enclensis]|uniref:Cysteine protease n=1 Tax=Fictibacillus enclensis TaxID=1017270 RepID=A0A0V8JAS3_9BACL|nr:MULTISPECIES: type 1 glutamine amidotransferase domain-containing protein [Fictibacillus]KSU84109.1 cysteine protease [Fictibacillus enclensis]MDM5197705.1 type 1 glutamine amidotransferase domain-containing protein [Fictibacillus enclensis]MDM5336858.1 type 1 glutamine amidotransferase domain-containing protein [Fictibacillus enclensis]RXZ00279.1 type 1 glutamine amidotransferase [Fictibacillus sp. S7]WHY73284.1 type 1 glutamine amidotransferase domain-containing protein [Fictibacillus enc
MAKIATVLTNLFEDVELTDPAKAYKEAGHQVTVIGFEKGQTLKGKQQEATVTSDAGIGEVSPSDFDALFIPGGFSPDQLRDDERFVSFAKEFADNGKPIFAICHGPQLLITAGVLKDRKVTGYNSIKVDLKNAGANFVDEEVVVCGGNLVTSRQPDDIPAFNRESLSILSKLNR